MYSSLLPILRQASSSTASTRAATTSAGWLGWSNNVAGIRSQHTASPAAAVTDQQNFKEFHNIPGPVSLPFFKTAWIFFPIIGRMDYKKLHRVQASLADKYGKLIRLDMPGAPTVLVLNANDIETVFRNQGAYPTRPGLDPLGAYRELRPDLYKHGGITVLQGEEWHRVRSNVQPHMLRPKMVQMYIPDMEKVAMEMVERIKESMAKRGEMEDFITDLRAWAIESMGHVSLNTRLGCLQSNLNPESEPARMMAAGLGIIRGLTETVFGIPLWMIVPTRGWKLLSSSHQIFEEIAMKHINRAMELSKDRDEDDELTLLETFIQKRSLDPKEAMLMAIDMFIGGIDTTSNTMGFTFYNLARHQDKQEMVYQELKRTFPAKDTPITVDSLQKLPYLKACVKETLRLYPVVIGTVRVLDKEIVLSGYKIPPGVILMTGMMTSANLEENFPNPTKYEPERWLTKKDSYHPFSYLPFGHGPRMCIGRRLAEQEMHILMCKLIQNFRVEYDHEDIDYVTGLTNTPDKPLKYKFIERS